MPKIDPEYNLNLVSDADIWINFKSGDTSVFSFIYQTHTPALFNYGMKISDDRNLVKDCIQDLFVDIWRNRANLGNTDNIKFYLYKALRRRIFHHIKTSQRNTLFEKQVANGNEFEQSPEETLIFLQEEINNSSLLKKTINELPNQEREVILLYFFEGYNYEDIAEIMNINVRSVYTLAWKAVSSIKKNLKLILNLFLILFIFV